MCYDDLLNSNIPLITLDLIDYSVKVFSYLKAMNFNLKDEDLVDLSFFMSVIITDNFDGTKSIFKDFAIGEYSISANFNININSLKLYCKDTSIDIEYYYDEYFNVFFNNILNDNIIIENIYPEDIILNTLENYYINNFLYSFLSFDNKTESELIDSLKSMSIKRLNNKSEGITYDRINSVYLPFETAIMIKNALKWYNVLFNKHNYKNDNIKSVEDKVFLCFFLTILDIPQYEITKCFNQLLSKNNINKENILNYFNLIEEYIFETSFYEENELENIYNNIFRKEIDKMFFGIWNVGIKNKKIFPIDIFKEICNSNLVYDFLKNFSISDDEIKNFFKFEDRQKFFNINSYKDKNGYPIKNKNNQEERKYELLKKYGYFLDEKKYFSNPAIGRKEEIKNIIITLLKPNKSAILVGEAGVGKTAVVEGIAYLLQNKNVPDRLKNMKIISITTNSLLAGCQYRGQFEERVEEILEFLKSHKEVILFIDEIHTIMGAGSAREQKLDFANILKPYLDRGDIKIIGSTTNKEYDELITDSALRRRFEKTNIKELDIDKLVEILKNEIKKLENSFNITFDFNETDKYFIINLLLNLTKEKNKVYNDKINNPDLVLSILSDFFASASYYNRDKIILEDIKFAILRCDRIYDSVKEREVFRLQQIKNKNEVEKTKVLKLFPDIKS